MNINKFKEDDIITRSEPNPRGDRSYQNDRLQFVGVESGMIVLIKLEEPFLGELVKLEVDWWSEGWDYYPQGLIDKAIKKVKGFIKPPLVE